MSFIEKIKICGLVFSFPFVVHCAESDYSAEPEKVYTLPSMGEIESSINVATCYQSGPHAF